jgi:hypothetical protein
MLTGRRLPVISLVYQRTIFLKFVVMIWFVWRIRGKLGAFAKRISERYVLVSTIVVPMLKCALLDFVLPVLRAIFEVLVLEVPPVTPE